MVTWCFSVFFFVKQISQKLLGQTPKNGHIFVVQRILQVYSAAWSPFGDVILTACGDDRIRVFRPKVGVWGQELRAAGVIAVIAAGWFEGKSS